MRPHTEMGQFLRIGCKMVVFIGVVFFFFSFIMRFLLKTTTKTQMQIKIQLVRVNRDRKIYLTKANKKKVFWFFGQQDTKKMINSGLVFQELMVSGCVWRWDEAEYHGNREIVTWLLIQRLKNIHRSKNTETIGKRQILEAHFWRT